MAFNFLGEDQRVFLSRGYLKEGQTPEQRYKQICQALEDYSGIEGFALKFYEYCEKGWISFATPVLINFGHGENLPCSCNFTSIEKDSLHDILMGVHELGMLSKYGAGTAVDFSNIRPLGAPISTGGNSEGVVSWVKLYEETINKVSQGKSRRGSMAAYLRTDHGDIMDFLDIATPHHPIQHITTGVIVHEGLLEDAQAGDKKSQQIVAKILKRRSEIGFPYIVFEKNVYKNIPKFMEDIPDKDMARSNLCSETTSDVKPNETFVCVLSSVNLAKYDEWKGTDFVYDTRIALDCVTEEYIQKARGREGFERALRYIENHRTVGLGAMGFHTYLQSKGIPMGSIHSYSINEEMFSYIRSECDRANRWMGENWGESEYCKGSGLRGDLSMAIAPNKSSAFIMGGVSEGIQPYKSNYHTKVLAKIQTEWKNPLLVELLEKLGKNTEEVWDSIKNNFGSVQHLDFIGDNDKEVFKTFSEISQVDLIKLAAQRQRHIDQGQSLNIMIHPSTSPKDVLNLIMEAYNSGVKSLYYSYSLNASQEFSKKLMECSSCEG